MTLLVSVHASQKIVFTSSRFMVDGRHQNYSQAITIKAKLIVSMAYLVKASVFLYLVCLMLGVNGFALHGRTNFMPRMSRILMTTDNAVNEPLKPWVGAKSLSSKDKEMQTILSNDQIANILPHRYPFLLVDRVVEFEAGKRAVGIKCVTANEPQFTGHFPGRPIMPGVLMIEAMAQLGAILTEDYITQYIR